MTVRLACAVTANPSAKPPSAGRLASIHAKFQESVAQSVMVRDKYDYGTRKKGMNLTYLVVAVAEYFP